MGIKPLRKNSKMAGQLQTHPDSAQILDRELSMTTVFRDDLIRIQILRRKFGDDNSQKCISRALDLLENALEASEVIRI